MSNAPVLPPLILSVTSATWRCHNTDSEEKDGTLLATRHMVMQRDKFTCQGCGAATMNIGTDPKKAGAPVDPATAPGTRRGSGYFEFHNIDDDHTHNEVSNLALVCPYCHAVYHCGNVGAHATGLIIEAPWISQADLNLLCHAMFSVISRSEDKIYMGEIPSGTPPARGNRPLDPEQAGIVRGIAEEVRRRYAGLQNLAGDLERRLGSGLSDPAKYGEQLMTLFKEAPKRYAERAKFQGGARYLPSYDYFNTPINETLLSPIQYWAVRHSNESYAPLHLNERLSQWKTVINQITDR